MSQFRYIKNHRSIQSYPIDDPSTYSGKAPELPKEEFRRWCADPNTDHCFFTTCIGINPNVRVSLENPVHTITGFIADYDVPAPPDFKEKLRANRKLAFMPTFSTHTASGHFRLIWMFSEPVLAEREFGAQFLTEIANEVHANALFAGYDPCSESVVQLFEAGTQWEHYDSVLDPSVVTSCLFRAVSRRPVRSEVNIPMDVVEEECLKRFGHRITTLKVGDRVPLFWIDDGIDRIGGQVTEHGIQCFSTRAGKGFIGWPELLGGTFVHQYQTNKIGSAVDGVWYDGKRYYRYTGNGLFDFPKDDLTMELRASGLNPDKKKGQRVSEVENALLFIQRQNRIHGVAPILHSKEKVVTINGSVILNSARNKPVEPAATGDPSEFPFLASFFDTFLEKSDDGDPKEYLFAWMKRAYEAMHYGQMLQGQAVILVGPTGRGKSLFSNRILAGLLGGVATASDYLQARTQFNRELAENPVWSVDDTASATNAADHRKFTELLKARIANPMIDVQAKYVDSMRVPHCGRVVISLNEDVQSLAVVPALDVSNADKILGFRINPDHKPEFLPNLEMEAVIDRELPHFARFLLDWQPPEAIIGSARYGVATYIHPFIMNAARDNGSRAPALEAIELFARVHRESTGHTMWRGTATELRSLFGEYSDLNGLAFGRDHFGLARGLAAAEEAYLTNAANARPVTSESRGKGKRYTINLSEDYDDK